MGISGFGGNGVSLTGGGDVDGSDLGEDVDGLVVS